MHQPRQGGVRIGSGDERELLDAAGRLRRDFTSDRAALARTLAAALATRQAPAAARQAAARLADEAVVAVCCGQQPAVGGGPLYDLAKAVHALRVAERLRAAGQAAVALFWCASEDHDHDEARHLDLVQRDGSLRRFTGELPRPRASLHHQPVAAWWEELLAALRELEGGSLGADWWRARAPLAAEEDLGTWQCRLLDACLGGRGLVTVQAHELRPLQRKAWQAALSAWPAAALQREEAALRELGGEAAFTDLQQPPCFADGPGARRPLDAAEAARVLVEHPEQLSPGAALRPALQQACIPCAVYCAGPGEIAYHRQLGPVFAAMAVPPPLLLPRLRLELQPGWWRRAVAAWGLRAEALRHDRLPAATPHREPGLEDLRRNIDALTDAAGDEDTRRRLVTGQARLRREYERLQASLQRGERHRAGRRPVGALQAWLRPRHQPQERVLSCAQALWQHGPGLVESIWAASADAGAGELVVVAL